MSIVYDSVSVGDHSSCPFFTFGNGDQDLLILPGITVEPISKSAPMLEQVFQDMPEFRFIVCGLRDISDGNFSFDQSSDDIASVCKALKISKAYAFGASMGGVILQSLCIRHPEICRKAFLASTSAYTSYQSRKTIDQWLSLASRKDRSGLADHFARILYTEDLYHQIRDTMIDSSFSWTDKMLSDFQVRLSALRSFDYRKELRKISCPVISVGSSSDLFWGSSAVVELSNLLDCTLHLYPSPFQHACYDEAPDFHSFLKDFFLRDNIE